jgi:hypothetical protein
MGKSGFTFEGSGRLHRVDTFTARSGKDIITLVLQVEGTYPQLVPIKFFGRLAEEVRDLTIGDVIEVTGHLGGRDWNGKVFGDNIGEAYEVIAESSSRSACRGQQSGSKAPDPLPGYSDDDIPF